MTELFRRQYMETGILLAMAGLVYGWITNNWTFSLIAAGILIISLTVPVIFKPITFLWFGLAKILSFLTSNILLGLLFFFLVTPVGLFRKFLGKDILKLKDFKKSSNSVLVNRNHTFKSSDLKNPF